jgi:hypothetical protein
VDAQSVDPGLVYVNVCSESIRVVDVKIQMTQVPRQTVMTKDNGELALVWLAVVQMNKRDVG